MVRMSKEREREDLECMRFELVEQMAKTKDPDNQMNMLARGEHTQEICAECSAQVV